MSSNGQLLTRAPHALASMVGSALMAAGKGYRQVRPLPPTVRGEELLWTIDNRARVSPQYIHTGVGDRDPVLLPVIRATFIPDRVPTSQPV